ncbi:uncharacterized protein LOC113235468 isoform X2 [Hyposmocoma kahamanoa]|uniref:uncharacterized protein LOC113235468 isoform X2 n=1 Tax=Hyposmocoma kahamanoa TaxID=1477025 RepID=UPI000E6D6738|nr:uncharacterized protein LOC113235468 isoform X2 [Hyposmocoma kahamanoa]
MRLQPEQNLVVSVCAQISEAAPNRARIHDDDSVDLPEDFVKYVQQLGASVFKVTEKSFDTRGNRDKLVLKSSNTSTVLVRKKNDLMVRSTQNAALRDILMLKLVSYYEDKYKLSRVDGVATTTRTTEPLALERLFDNPEFTRYSNTKHNNRRSTATKRTIARRRRYPNANSSGSSRLPMPSDMQTMYENAAEVVVI